jgi:hypothetical protein
MSAYPVNDPLMKIFQDLYFRLRAVYIDWTGVSLHLANMGVC